MTTAVLPNPTIPGISEQLAQRIGPHKYDMWFGHTTRLQVDGQRVQVATNSRFVADWIDGHFLRELHDVAREALGEDARVDVRVVPDLFGANGHSLPEMSPRAEVSDRRHGAEPAGPESRSGQRRCASLRRLEDFVVGESNKLAFAAASRIADEHTATSTIGGSPLVLHGECGVGKTHLLQGICQRFAQRSDGRDHLAVRYVTAEQFTNEYINAVRTNTIARFRKRTRKLDLLAIDDVHFLANKVATQSEFLHTVDAIDLVGARVVLASDEHPRRLGFSQALRSRFVSGMVVKIERPDREMRVTLAHQLAASRGFRLGEAAAETIAARCVGSVRELEGAVNKLAALRLLADGPGEDDVGAVAVERVFNDGGWRPRTPLRISAVLSGVCDRLLVNRAQLIGSGRHRRVVLARGLVAYLARELTTLSYPEIAHALARKHHSTVHTAVRRIARHLSEQRMVDLTDHGEMLSLNELVDQLRHQILHATHTP